MRYKKLPCVFAVAAAGGGCGTAQPTATPPWPPGEGTHLNAEALTLSSPIAIPSSQPLMLLASVATQTGSTFEFYDDEAGSVLYSEFGGKDVKPISLNLQGLSPSQVWAQVAPGRPVPSSITSAEAASAAPNMTPASSSMPAVGSQRGTGPTSPPAGELHALNASPPPGDPNDFCSGAWAYKNMNGFANYCNGGNSYDWCWYDVGPGGSAQGTNVHRDGVSICNKNSSSDVFLNVNRNNGQGGNSWSVPSSSWRWYSHDGGTCCGIFYCNCTYNVQITNPGSWGDLQFAGFFDW